MAPTSALAVATARKLAAVVAELAAVAVTVAMSAPAAAEPGLVVAAVTVAKSARVAVAALAQEVAILVGVPVVKCPPCSRLSAVLLDQCFAAVRQSPDNSR